MPPSKYAPPTPVVLQWVAHHVHPRAQVTAVAPLLGGITADMDRVTVDTPTGLTDVVLRRWPGDDGATDLVKREASALVAVRGWGVPAPQLLAMDEDGAETGVRCTLTSALAGQPDLSPRDMRSWLGQLATAQVAIHAVPVHPPTRWDGWYRDDRPLDWLADRGLRDAARQAASGPLVEEKVLVHGDYQHFNVLWCKGQLSGVVDWPSAATGNRGSDVGHCRLNLAVLFDAKAAEVTYRLTSAPRAFRWTGEPTCERCSLSTSSGSASSHFRSLVGLRSTYPGCLVEWPLRSAAPWTG